MAHQIKRKAQAKEPQWPDQMNAIPTKLVTIDDLQRQPNHRYPPSSVEYAPNQVIDLVKFQLDEPNHKQNNQLHHLQTASPFYLGGN